MDIQELKKKKKDAGMTNPQISELTGVPLSTVNKIFSGATKNPRYSTLLAIEEVLTVKEKLPFEYVGLEGEVPYLLHEKSVYQYKARNYSEEDWDKLTDYARAELIDNKLYLMAQPSRVHQKILQKISYAAEAHITSKKGKCEVYPAPFKVKLFDSDEAVVEPDISVICNLDILNDEGCYGAPDWVVEIVSPSNFQYDYVVKMIKYQKAGVREYWIVNPMKRTVSVYNFEDEQKSDQYVFEDTIPVGVLEGLEIRVADWID